MTWAQKFYYKIFKYKSQGTVNMEKYSGEGKNGLEANQLADWAHYYSLPVSMRKGHTPH